MQMRGLGVLTAKSASASARDLRDHRPAALQALDNDLFGESGSVLHASWTRTSRRGVELADAAEHGSCALRLRLALHYEACWMVRLLGECPPLTAPRRVCVAALSASYSRPPPFPTIPAFLDGSSRSLRLGRTRLASSSPAITSMVFLLVRLYVALSCRYRTPQGPGVSW